MSKFYDSLRKQMSVPSVCLLCLDNRFGNFQSLAAPRWLLLAMLALLLLAPTAYASTIITLGTNCSLANAIRSSNGGAQVAPANQCAAGAANTRDIISFVADVEISEALPAITTGVSILGKGYSLSPPTQETGENSASYDFNLLTVTDGDVYIEELTLSGAEDSAIKAAEADNDDIKLRIIDSVFSDNTAATNGGAVFVGGGAEVQIQSSTIRRNSAPNGNGGAIYSEGSWLYVFNNIIEENSAGGNGGAIHYMIDPNSLYQIVHVDRNRFKSNEATDNDATTNTAGNGGAIYVSNSERTFSGTEISQGAKIENNSFTDHSARNGGAIYADSGKLRIYNNTIDEGEASAKGGGIYIAGGPVYLHHNTIINNQAANGGGMAIFTNAQDSTQNPVVNLYNSIIAENTNTDTTDTTCFRDALTANSGNIIEDSNCAAAQAAVSELLIQLVEGGTTISNSKGNRYYRLLEGSPAIDSGDGGQERRLPIDQIGMSRPQGAGYDIGSYEYMVAAPEEPERGSPGSGPAGGSPGSNEPGGASGKSQSETSRQASKTVHTCVPLSEADNGIEIAAAFGLESGVQCQEIDARGIGIQSVIEAGFIKAVDVWGYVSQGVQVCFNATGPLLFLDATTSPRMVMSIASFALNGKTCTAINRPGSIVLQPSGTAIGPLPLATVQSIPASAAEPGARRAADSAPSSCKVTTTETLNFRTGPGRTYDSLTVLPVSVTLTVLDRTDDWYQVDWYGRPGWISADYARPHGDCG